GLIWSKNIGISDSNLALSGNIIVVGGSYNAYILQLNGTAVNIINTKSQVTGIAVSGNISIYQSSSSIYAITAGNVLWYSNISATYGAAFIGSHPVAASGIVYSIWSNNYLIAQNISNGGILWTSKIPYKINNVNMTLAYGHLYLPAGDELIAYGACNQNPQESVLQASVSLYLNGYGSCADYLLNYMDQMGNYTIEIGSNDITDASIASFRGSNSYAISGGNYSQLNSFTISFWAYPKGSPAAQESIIDSSPRTLMVGISQSGNAIINPGTPSTISTSTPIKYNSWSFILLEAQISQSNTIYTLYINGTRVASGSVAQNIQPINSITFGSLQNPYNGLIANVQFYGSNLNTRQISYLYQEGIQGSPLSNLELLSWYPLDGDLNDYGPLHNAAYGINVSYANANYVKQSLANAYNVGAASTMLSIQNYTTEKASLHNIRLIAWT
ncbi:MAG: LamG-like jellyroll fold domain-containing protein, partial [Candidatus Micrarchaeaceae archaeon]